MSTDALPAQRRLIAFVTDSVGYQQWNTLDEQESSAIYLMEGEAYYIEALHKEGAGDATACRPWC